MVGRFAGWCLGLGLSACGPVLEDGGGDDDGGATAPRPAPEVCSVEPVDACEAACDLLVGCHTIAGGLGECVARCLSDLAAPSPECAALKCEIFACRGGRSCSTVGDDACASEVEAFESQCNEEACTVEVSDDGACELSCDYGPLYSRWLTCEGTRCACNDRGTLTETCDFGAPVCDAPDRATMDALAASCCGW